MVFGITPRIFDSIPPSLLRKKIRRFRAKEDRSIHEIRSKNLDSRRENRIKKMNRKAKEIAKEIAKAIDTKLKQIYQKYSKKLWIEYTKSILFFILSTL